MVQTRPLPNDTTSFYHLHHGAGLVLLSFKVGHIVHLSRLILRLEVNSELGSNGHFTVSPRTRIAYSRFESAKSLGKGIDQLNILWSWILVLHPLQRDRRRLLVGRQIEARYTPRALCFRSSSFAAGDFSSTRRIALP